jgi:5-methylcytosine-specific restriction endonuclease McrA
MARNPNPKANPRKSNGHRRRQVTAQVYAEETHCAICGVEVDKSIPYIDPSTGKPHPWAKSVDEIIPVTKGGSATLRSNCRLAHRRCNIQRGDGSRGKTLTGPPQVRKARDY